MSEIERVAQELVALFRSLKGVHRAVLAEAGLRIESSATAVLAALEEGGRQRASALADVLGLDLSSVSRQVAALERDGWVRRERDPADSRAALLEVTPAGRAVLRDVRAARLAHLSRRLPGWHPDELRLLADLLHRFRADLLTPVDPQPAAPAAAPDSSAVPRPPDPAPAGAPALARKEG